MWSQIRKDAMTWTLLPYEEDPVSKLEQVTHWMDHYSPTPLETGSTNSNGPTGEPSLSERSGARVVRHHRGLSTISVHSLLTGAQDVPGTFLALRREGSAGYMVTVSCDLTSSQWAGMLMHLGVPGENNSVDVKFAPTTGNLVRPTTAPSI